MIGGEGHVHHPGRQSPQGALGQARSSLLDFHPSSGVTPGSFQSLLDLLLAGDPRQVAQPL